MLREVFYLKYFRSASKDGVIKHEDVCVNKTLSVQSKRLSDSGTVQADISTYRHVASIYHQGCTLYEGHYTASVRNYVDKRTIHFNDSSVRSNQSVMKIIHYSTTNKSFYSL